MYNNRASRYLRLRRTLSVISITCECHISSKYRVARGLAYLVDVGTVSGVYLEHAVDEVLQPLGVCGLRVFVLCVHDSHCD